MHASRWATILTANTTDTVHTSSFEYRATLFQRLFASSSDFDLVCREFLADGNQAICRTRLVEELQWKPMESSRRRG